MGMDEAFDDWEDLEGFKRQATDDSLDGSEEVVPKQDCEELLPRKNGGANVLRLARMWLIPPEDDDADSSPTMTTTTSYGRGSRTVRSSGTGSMSVRPQRSEKG